MIGYICLCDVDWNQVDGEFCVGGQEVGAREEELWRLDLKKDLKFKASIAWDYIALMQPWSDDLLDVYALSAKNELLTTWEIICIRDPGFTV